MMQSIARLRNPETPETDLCGLEFSSATLPAVAFQTIHDEFPNSTLERFTRKCLHMLPDLFDRPRHRICPPDGPRDIVGVLFGEQNSIPAILNNFE